MTSLEQISNYHEQLLLRSEQVLAEAVAIVAPATPDASPLDVFPAPNERRADDLGLALSSEQETELRTKAAELGFGRESDSIISETGLAGGYVFIEGGQPHKVAAEATMVTEDMTAQPRAIIFGGSKRAINNPAELASAEHQNAIADTEYDMVRKVAEQINGFESAEVEQALPFGYDISNSFAPVSETTGQFVKIGTANGADIVLMRVDREDYVDESGASKYRNQPGSDAILSILNNVLLSVGDQTSPLALVTSSIYQASRSVDAARLAIQTGRSIGCATYGTARLAATKGEAAPAPASIAQLPGELYKLAKQIGSLRTVLHPNLSEE